MGDPLCLLACQRYIELNAVPARMTPNPEDYRWTSFRANALRTADPVVAPRPLYTAVAGRSDESRRAVYRSLFDDQLPDTAITELRDATNGGFA